MGGMGSFAGAFAGGATVQIVISAVDDFSGTMEKAGKGLEGFSKYGQATTMALGTVATTGVAAVGAMSALAIGAAKAGDVQEQFNKLAGADAAKTLEGLRAATNGTKSDMELMGMANDALIKGMKADALPVMAQYAQRLGDANPKFADVSDSMAQMTQAAVTGRTTMLKGMGVTVDSAKVLDDYAASIGTTKDKLTEEQQTMALQAAVLDGVKSSMDNLAPSTVDAADKMEQMTANIDNMKVKIGEAFLPAVEQMMSAGMPMFQQLTDILMTQVVPAATFAAQAFADLMTYLSTSQSFQMLITFLGYVAEGLGTFIGLVFKGIETVVGFADVILAWGKIGKDVFVDKFKAIWGIFKNEFILVKEGVILGLEGIELFVYKMINGVISGFETMVNGVVSAINILISAYNSVADVLGLSQMSEIGKVDFSNFKIDTSSLESDMTARAGNIVEAGKQMIINIENLSGLDADAIAKALQDKLKTMV